MSVKTKLEDEFNDQMDELNSSELGTEEYLNTVKGVCMLADKLITIQKQDDDFELKSRELEMEKEAKEAENQQTKKRNRVEWAKVLVPTGCGLVLGVASMVWEKFDTMTLTTGKNTWKDLISFKVFK